MKRPTVLIWILKSSLALGAIFILLGFASSFLMTEGSMPSLKKAKSVKSEAIQLFNNYDGTIDQSISDFPPNIKKLNPLNVYFEDLGVMIIFKSSFVEDYGFFYTYNGKDLPENRIFYERVSDGIYKYYNPG